MPRVSPPSPARLRAKRRGAETFESVDNTLALFPSFREGSWLPWRAFIRALDALPLTAPELEAFRQHTGRQAPPSEPVREAHVPVGRRGGKSQIAALVALDRALRLKPGQLAPGEVGTVAVIASDRRQAGVVYGYVRGLIDSVPRLRAMVVGKPARDRIALDNGAVIEIHTASFRSVRGYTMLAVIADESSFWMNAETSANPDREIFSALRPSLMTTKGILLDISTPYGRRGVLWDSWKKWYGQDGRVLVWQGTSCEMNPTLDPLEVEAAREADPQAASAEYDAQFRSDLETFISEELLASVTADRGELRPRDGTRYHCFVDASGGRADSYAMAVAHPEPTGHVVLDLVLEVRPPFNPESVTEQFAEVAKTYRCGKIVGDAYGAEWVQDAWRRAGLGYQVSELTASEVFLEGLPLLTSGRAELYAAPRLVGQLVALERRTGRQGRDTVSHPPGGHDDVAVCAMGALVLAKGSEGSFPSETIVVRRHWQPAPAEVRYVGNDTIVVDGQAYKDP
jgi:hypothetical protein